MSRTVAALYDSRAEAEFARARLVSRLKARSPRIISKDTIGAIDTVDIADAEKDAYRTRLRGGGHLVVAEAPAGANAARIIELLKEAVGRKDRRADQEWGDGERGVHVELPDARQSQTAGESGAHETIDSHQENRLQLKSEAAGHRRIESVPEVGGTEPDEESRSEEQRPSMQERSAGARDARVRSYTRDAPAEEQVVLLDDLITIENRSDERSLSEAEIEAGDLFKERVIEVAEMREEPVVTKVAVVREEVIVRKTVKERTETIRDTVRQTQVEVEDLSEDEDSDPVFFGG
jgi:stress response protein YsnF